ncbi:hypothetical protein [Metasolibacillus meyeri]|uniref:hypothetical protein n=1 Tax=Metasolibacillus meyeri TaxID=1071052 RepID=UPI000D3005A7|nr:hypothetical protein [Metasolibacillus meyeri]
MEEIAWYRSGRRLYFLKSNGKVIYDVGDSEGTVEVEKSFAFDYENIPMLNEHERSDIDFIDLEYGQYREEFASCVYYQITPISKDVQFAFGDTGTPTLKLPLEKRVEDLENALLLQAENEIGGIL